MWEQPPSAVLPAKRACLGYVVAVGLYARPFFAATACFPATSQGRFGRSAVA